MPAMQIKGTGLNFLPDYINSKYGKEKFEKWLAALPPASKDIYSNRIMASSWYPLEAAMAVPLRSICDTFHGGDVKGAWETGRYSADYGLSGVYKLMVKLGSPESLARRATQVLPTYYNPCAMECLEASPGKAVLRVTDFSEMNRYLENRLGGYMERAVEISGGKDVKSCIGASMTKGDKFTEYSFTWK
jgi:hypothetical protein